VNIRNRLAPHRSLSSRWITLNYVYEMSQYVIRAHLGMLTVKLVFSHIGFSLRPGNKELWLISVSWIHQICFLCQLEFVEKPLESVKLCLTRTKGLFLIFVANFLIGITHSKLSELMKLYADLTLRGSLSTNWTISIRWDYELNVNPGFYLSSSPTRS